MVVMGGIKVFPGEEIDGIFQAFEKVFVKNAVGFMFQNIVISKALPGSQLIEKLAGILKGTDVDDSNLLYRLKESLKGAVELRTEIPEHNQTLLSLLRQLPGGINHPHPIA